jgi:hypothetical protein
MSLPILAETISRQAGLEQLDRNVNEVRRLMNSDPERMDQTLAWYIVRPVGDNPRVLALCDEIIQKSTNPKSVLHAVGDVEGMLIFHGARIAKAHRKKAVEAVLRHALEHPSPLVQLQSAETLRLIDKDVMVRAYVNILNSPAISVDDNVRWSMVLGVRRLLESDRAETRNVVRTASEKYGLVDFLDAALNQGNFRGKREEIETLLQKWRAVLGEKK